ncbi:MAG TPA: metalloregulator ArsR/SmtB family transcription factor [Solirubrobacterales bacterium]|nr:metalloregulator ArsR/SmtB family transcription factor [Solirubrobacterales bacterium]
MALKMKSPLDNAAAELISRRFRALGDPTRLRILDQLRTRGEASVGELTEALGGSQQNVSKHLAALHAEGFVSRRKRGTSSLYRISDPGVLDLCDKVCAGIESQLAALGAMLGG